MKEKDVFPNRKARTIYELLFIILESCKEPQNISALFCTLKTSYPIFEKILNEAIHLKLLKKTTKRYVLTPKGQEYLIRWEGFLKFLKET